MPQPSGATGRPAYSNQVLLPGILKVLRSGCRWRDLDTPGLPSGVTHWRRLRLWERKSKLWWLWRRVLVLLHGNKKVDLSTTAIDGTLTPSFAFKSQTGYSGKYHRTGTKLVSVTESAGLPVALVFSAGNRHDSPLALPALKRLKVGNRTRPEIVLGDKGFDSLTLRRSLRQRGIKTNIPEREFKTRRKRGRPPHYDKQLGRKRYSWNGSIAG